MGQYLLCGVPHRTDSLPGQRHANRWWPEFLELRQVVWRHGRFTDADLDGAVSVRTLLCAGEWPQRERRLFEGSEGLSPATTKDLFQQRSGQCGDHRIAQAYLSNYRRFHANVSLGTWG